MLGVVFMLTNVLPDQLLGGNNVLGTPPCAPAWTISCFLTLAAAFPLLSVLLDCFVKVRGLDTRPQPSRP